MTPLEKELVAALENIVDACDRADSAERIASGLKRARSLLARAKQTGATRCFCGKDHAPVAAYGSWCCPDALSQSVPADEVSSVLGHLQTCRPCSEGDWRDCDGGRKALQLMEHAKSTTGAHEFTVTDDGHGRAMAGGRRLAYGGMGLEIGDKVNTSDTWGVGLPVNVGTRVRVELRDGCDFATLVEAL